MSERISRLASRFSALKAANKKALIPYITAGDSNPAITVPLMHAMVEAGADVVELGVPFSDPGADGPAIQLACERALAHNVSLSDVIEMVKTFREQDAETPVVLMGYLNPIEAMGYEAFAKRASTAGVDAVLTVDMPPEESEDVLKAFRAHSLDTVFLVSPESTLERFRMIAKNSSGFIYYVSLKGVTGVKDIDTNAVAEKMAEFRKETDLPIGVGFGIKDAKTAADTAKLADAVIVGSAIVRRIEASQDNQEKIIDDIKGFLSELRIAIDSI